MDNSWYSVEAKSDSAEVLIYNEIGRNGVTSADFAKDLQAIKSKEIVVRLNTPGGSVFDGMAIYNSLKSHPARIVAKIDGLAASIGSVIAMAADEIQIAKNAHMMIHNASMEVYGNSKDLRSAADFTEKMSMSIAQTYAERTKQPMETIQGWMNEETWMNAEEAINSGFADKITDTVKLTNVFDLSQFKKPPSSIIAKAVSEVVDGLESHINQSTKEIKMNGETFAKYAAEYPDASEVKAIKDIGIKAGKESGRKEAIEDLSALIAAIPNRPDFVVAQFIKGHDVQAAKADLADILIGELNDANKKAAEAVAPVKVDTNTGTGAIPLAKPAEASESATAPAGLNPKATAEWEWDNKQEVRNGFSSKGNYVAYRQADIDGSHRSFNREPVN